MLMTSDMEYKVGMIYSVNEWIKNQKNNKNDILIPQLDYLVEMCDIYYGPVDEDKQKAIDSVVCNAGVATVMSVLKEVVTEMNLVFMTVRN